MSDERSPDVPSGARAGQSPGDGRRGRGDVPAAAVTNGAAGGTGGGGRSWFGAADPRDLGRALLVIVPITGVVITVNALTNLSDIPDIEVWEPWVWEVSSALTIFVGMVVPWLATAAAPPDEAAGEGWKPKLKFVGVHLAALLIFSAFHVAGFVALRSLAYDLMGAGPYEFGDRFIYELRKDFISYSTYVATFWLIGYLRRRKDEPVRPVSFDIRDGARIIRVPLADILAVSSAGNYVEFWLSDGRRPLMRATLAAIEVELERFGFVRAHRSWLVNAGSVTGLRPEGSGDWTVELGAVEAPVSRRYPQALERLRG